MQAKTIGKCYVPFVDVHPGILTMWLILPAGCTGASPVTNPATDTTAPAVSAPVPEWTGEQAAAQMESLADQDFPDPTQLRELYLSMLQAGDSRCPGENIDELADGSIPLGGCTSSTGYHYVGLSEFTESNDDGWSFALTLGDLYITDPNGDTFSAGGTFSYDAKVTDAGSQWKGDATGTFSYPGGTHWVAEGGSLAYWVEGGTAVDHEWLLLSGSIGGPLGTDNLYFDQLLYDSDCGESPVGGLRVRGGDGRWYHLEFDADCSGCGTLTFSDTVEMGQVCVDLKSLGAELIERMAL